MNTLPPRIEPVARRHWGRLFLALLVLALVIVPMRATTVVPPQFTELVEKSDYIVRVVVKSVSSELRTVGGNKRIVTKVELEVREAISGAPPQPLVLEMLGGKVGNEEMVVPGIPRFQAGDEDILFVRGNGKQFCPLVALLYGRYPVKRDAQTGRHYVTRGDGTPLVSEVEVARPMALPENAGRGLAAQSDSAALPLTPADFIDRIKAATAKNSTFTPTNP